jgi:hypothetical protein
MKNEKVRTFLASLKATDPESYNLVAKMRNIILDSSSDVEEKMMYGGIVFFLNAEMLMGLFSYKNHTTIEFATGFLMNDPNNLLEGKGKYRRHLKISNGDDIIIKKVSNFVRQQYNLI